MRITRRKLGILTASTASGPNGLVRENHGRLTQFDEANLPPFASVVLTVDDGGPGVKDKVSAPLLFVSSPPTCTGSTTGTEDTESVGVFDAL